MLQQQREGVQTRKRVWYEMGARVEEIFVQKLAPACGIRAQINPEKEKDPTLPDLVVDGQLADLKQQATPFFQASRLYGFNPQTTVTFNAKDYRRYCTRYPELDVYFWVDWQRVEAYGIKLLHTAGVWRVPFATLATLIESGRAPLHTYGNRRAHNDALDSYLFDLYSFGEPAICASYSRAREGLDLMPAGTYAGDLGQQFVSAVAPAIGLRTARLARDEFPSRNMVTINDRPTVVVDVRRPYAEASRYNMRPQTTIAISCDWLHTYLERIPTGAIALWVNFEGDGRAQIPMLGLFIASLRELAQALERESPPVVVREDGRRAYLFDLLRFRCYARRTARDRRAPLDPRFVEAYQDVARLRRQAGTQSRLAFPSQVAQ